MADLVDVRVDREVLTDDDAVDQVRMGGVHACVEHRDHHAVTLVTARPGRGGSDLCDAVVEDGTEQTIEPDLADRFARSGLHAGAARGAPGNDGAPHLSDTRALGEVTDMPLTLGRSLPRTAPATARGRAVSCCPPGGA
jgi:hypothetical protein